MTITKTTQKHQQTLRNEGVWDTTSVPTLGQLAVRLNHGNCKSGTLTQHPPYTTKNNILSNYLSQCPKYVMRPTEYRDKSGTPCLSH